MHSSTIFLDFECSCFVLLIFSSSLSQVGLFFVLVCVCIFAASVVGAAELEAKENIDHGLFVGAVRVVSAICSYKRKASISRSSISWLFSALDIRCHWIISCYSRSVSIVQQRKK